MTYTQELTSHSYVPDAGDQSIHHRRTTCRVCGDRRLRQFLSLGPTPLANAFPASPKEIADEIKFPLDVAVCESCALVQLLDVIDPEALFRNYVYVTGTSDSIATHNRAYAETVVELLNLETDDLVVEVASNDGSLLTCFGAYGVRTLGVEPATNIAEIARSRGVETLNVFFDSEAAQNIRTTYGPAKAVIGNNVLAHVDTPREFLAGCKHLLANDGLVIIEVPYLGELLNRLEYDTIYHEHLCYFSVSTLLRLCGEVGLSLIRIDHQPVHGGSLRMYAGLPDFYGDHSPAVQRLVAKEYTQGFNRVARYERFATDVADNRTAMRDVLDRFRRDGKTVAGYGAPAKGNTLLNYCGIDTELLPYTVDKNPLKVGLYTPGTHIPILPVETLLERQPDYTLILAWNFADEIMRQQATYYERGGTFLTPIPMPREVHP